MSHKTKRLGYSDKLGADEQISMEEMIARCICEPYDFTENEDEDMDICDRYPEHICQQMSREILYNVLRKFRPDLFEEVLTCPNCKWVGYKSGMDKTWEKGNIPDVSERVDEDGMIPVGECPDCGALVYKE